MKKVPALIAALACESSRDRHAAAKSLRDFAERRPELLVPYFDFFAARLEDSNRLVQWESVFILGRIAAVDPEGRFADVFDRYFAPIRGPVMITAGNVIKAGARLAAEKPGWAGRIVREILKVSKARYRTAECRRIAIGQAILALDAIYGRSPAPDSVLEFVRRQRNNSRPATRSKAIRFLRRRGLRSALPGATSRKERA